MAAALKELRAKERESRLAMEGANKAVKRGGDGAAAALIEAKENYCKIRKSLNLSASKHGRLNAKRSSAFEFYKRERSQRLSVAFRWSGDSLSLFRQERDSVVPVVDAVGLVSKRSDPSRGLTIGVNADYLYEAVRRMKGTVTLAFADNLSPFVLTDSTDRGLLTAIMPVRL